MIAAACLAAIGCIFCTIVGYGAGVARERTRIARLCNTALGPDPHAESDLCDQRTMNHALIYSLEVLAGRR